MKAKGLQGQSAVWVLGPEIHSRFGRLLPLLAGRQAMREKVLISTTQIGAMETSQEAIYTVHGPVKLPAAQSA